MAASVIKQRTIEKFIMSEFVQGNLNTKEQVSCMLILIQKKLGMSVEQASDFMRNTIGGKSSVSCPLKPSDSAPLKHSTMPP